MIDLYEFSADREGELNRALEALHFAFRAVVAKPDARLAEWGLTRIHHRILYFVGHCPEGSVNDLLGILGISKQYLNRPLRQLQEQQLVRAEPDPRDKRIKRLRLTEQGRALERELSGEQRRCFAAVFTEAGSDAEAAWRQVMTLLADSCFD